MKNNFVFFLLGIALEGLINASIPPAPKLTDDQIAEQTRIGNLIIYNLQQQISTYQEAIKAIIFNMPGMEDINIKINNLQDKITKEKTDEGITAIETQIAQLNTQLDQAAVNNYVKAIDPVDLQNLYSQINTVINKIYSDSITQDKLDNIHRLEQATVQHIRPYVDQIQQIGSTIDKITKTEQKQMDQILMQILPLQTQIISARENKETAEKLSSLESALLKSKNDLAASLYSLKDSEQQKIKYYKNAIKKLELMIHYIYNPQKTATTNDDEVALFEN